jgi:hypothetical protein
MKILKCIKNTKNVLKIFLIHFSVLLIQFFVFLIHYLNLFMDKSITCGL